MSFNGIIFPAERGKRQKTPCCFKLNNLSINGIENDSDTNITVMQLCESFSSLKDECFHVIYNDRGVR